MKEAELKKTIDDYLQYKMNAGELYFDRLNSGSLITVRGDRTFRVRLCREGTADYLVIQGDHPFGNMPTLLVAYPIFIELKSDKGMQTKEQREFQARVEAQGAQYFIVRNIEELEYALG